MVSRVTGEPEWQQLQFSAQQKRRARSNHGKREADGNVSACYEYIDAFEKLYQTEHVPMAVEKLKGKTKFVATKVTASPQGTPPFYRIAEVHFPSMEALQACATSQDGKDTLAHGGRISSGGPPVIMIAEEETFTF